MKTDVRSRDRRLVTPPLLLPAISLWCGTLCSIRSTSHDSSDTAQWFLLVTTGLLSLVPGPRFILLRLLLPFLLGTLLAVPTAQEAAKLPAGPVQIEGKIGSVPRRSLGRQRRPQAQPKTTFQLERLSIGDCPIAGAITVSIPGPVTVGRGDQIEVLLAAGSGPYRKVARASHWQVICSGKLLSLFDRLRLRALDRLLAIDAHWGCALLLGERGVLEAETRWVMKRTGLGHLLAVSGLHIGICLGFFLLCARICLPPWSHRIRCLGAVLLVCQALLSGADPPAIRAAFTGGLMALGVIEGRNVSAIQCLALALLIWCAMGQAPPRASATISLAAVGGIYFATGAHIFSRSTLRASFGAFFGAHAALVWWSPEISPFSPLTTIVMLPVVAATILLGVISLILSLFHGEEITRSGWQLLSFFLDTLPALADRLPWSPWILPTIGAPAITLTMTTLLGICAGKPRLAAASLLLALLAMTIHCSLETPPTVTLLPTGRGQSVLFRSPEATLLFDAAATDQIDGGASLIRKSLWNQGSSRVDWLFISHAHLDHFSAVPELVETGTVRGIVIDKSFGNHPAGGALVEMATRHGVRIHTVKTGDRLSLGPWRLRVISAADPATPSPRLSINDQSVVIAIRGPGGTAIIPGDAETARLVASRASGPIELVLLPHHGSPMQRLSNWIALLSPEQTLVARPGALPRATIGALRPLGIDSVPGNRKVAKGSKEDLPSIPLLSMMPAAQALPMRTREGWRRWRLSPQTGSGPCTGLGKPMAACT
ncbi:MAG: ComEC/Rec2 family competence protein [Planctomycetota bacterium]|nr:ComEC/Rec2 family competence protein [Planctomycetota bacterium]